MCVSSVCTVLSVYSVHSYTSSLSLNRRYLLKSAVVTPRKKWLHQHAFRKRHLGDIYEVQRRGTPSEPDLPSWITESMLYTKKYLLQNSVCSTRCVSYVKSYPRLYAVNARRSLSWEFPFISLCFHWLTPVPTTKSPHSTG